MVNLFSMPFFRAKGFEKSTLFIVFALFTLVLSLLAVFQDFLQSNYNSGAFYFSESLLFRSFWILTLPIVFVQMQLVKQQLKLHPLLKLFITMTIATLIHLLAFSALVNILSALLFDHTYTFGRVFYYSITEDLYKCVLIYCTTAGIYLYWPTKNNEKQIQTASILIIQNGRQHIALAIQDIIYIQSSNPYIAVHTLNKQHLHTASLKSILNELDEKQFVRIHKSTIVNLNEVEAYQSRLNGDYDIQLKNGSKLRLSRNYTAKFKKHFESTSA